MANKNKPLIESLERSSVLLGEHIASLEQTCSPEVLHVTDRLNANLSEIKTMAECLRQNGVIDEDLMLSDIDVASAFEAVLV